ncbi:leucine-rich repeat-containing protein 57 [Bicyclus anynana]|uniref:Leucine-rich repeat-containing protein 57 n=1 Tax=Bicyclus anynana TaxID=110368 RepID=A0A6J1N215_BICAN|nr:leucine-rich repeat-containing protein 57 [Bicyclus anynana]
MGNSGLKQHYETASKTGVLQISDHRLKEIPQDVFSLSEHLRNLDISKNKIVNLDDISRLKILKQLNVSTNAIQELPSSIGNLRKLEMLNVSFNSIHCLPDSFSNLSNLKQIYLNNNKFKQFPKQLLGLTNVEVIDLSNNKLTMLPSGMANMFAAELNLSQNEISSLGEDLHKAPRLKILRLDENCLGLDSITPSLLRDSKIHTITIDGNLFEPKQLTSLEGYNEYSERYTTIKKKMF